MGAAWRLRTRRTASASSGFSHIIGHGPAGVADFAWWSGLTLGQSREAVGPGKNGMVRPVVIERGRVIGTWSHAEATRHAPPELCATASDPEAVRAAVDRGVRFFGA